MISACIASSQPFLTTSFFILSLITRLRLLFSNGQASSLNFKNKIEEALVKPILGLIITSSIIYILKLILKRLDHPVK